jgi:small subunit ribosomal protein S8
MVITDSIGDLIIRLKNANRVGKESVVVSASKLKEAVANALKRAGFVAGVSKKGKDSRFLEIALAYGAEKAPKIKEVQRISKPSRRVYQASKDIKIFKNGFGATIISTPKGILSDKEAKKEKVGGEIMFKIW